MWIASDACSTFLYISKQMGLAKFVNFCFQSKIHQSALSCVKNFTFLKPGGFATRIRGFHRSVFTHKSHHSFIMPSIGHGIFCRTSQNSFSNYHLSFSNGSMNFQQALFTTHSKSEGLEEIQDYVEDMV